MLVLLVTTSLVILRNDVVDRHLFETVEVPYYVGIECEVMQKLLAACVSWESHVVSLTAIRVANVTVVVVRMPTGSLLSWRTVFCRGWFAVCIIS